MVASIMSRLTMLILLTLFFACSSAQPKQGIKGQVFWISGNQMPGPETKRSPHYGVQRTIHVYELTTIDQVSRSPEGFFSDIQTKLIGTLTTKPDGSFKLKLPPGEYSIFVEEPKGLYANLFDKNNAINAIHVKEKQYSWLPITIDYEAAF